MPEQASAVYDHAGVRIYLGDCRAVLQQLPEQSVQTVVTSPPYWALRDYGVDGQIGIEANVEEYVSELVAVFREVRRVLMDDGTIWVNLGDTYVGAPGQWQGTFNARYYGTSNPDAKMSLKRDRVAKGQAGLPPKSLIGIPWRVALALQADGWILRQDVIWDKPNAMPSSVRDRCTTSHEYLFMFSKQGSYYYDAAAIAEPAINAGRAIKTADNWDTDKGAHGTIHKNGREKGRRAATPQREMRNKRSVWSIPTEAFPGDHFATYPRKLVEPCILACARPDTVVLDPFAGTGTTGEVAKRLGRRAILIDIDAENLPMMKRRLQQDVLPIGGAA